jgi:hypothetical protein
MKKLLIISILFLVSLGGIAQKYHWPLNEWSTLPGVGLVEDGNFSLTGTQAVSTIGDYWTTDARWSITGGLATFDDVVTGALSQTETITSGLYYMFSFDVASSNLINLALFADEATIVHVNYRFYLSGSHSVVFKAGTTSSIFEIYGNGTESTGSWTITNIHIRELNFYSQEVQTGILGTGSYIHTVMDGSASGRREFELDGTSDYLEITDAALGEGGDFGTADFSVQVKFDPFNVTDQNKYLINKEAGGAGWGIQQYEDDVKIRFDDNTTDPSAIISTAVLTAGTLVDVIVVFDRDANATCYIDGVASGTVDISSANLTLSNAGALRLGTETGGTTNEFKGDLYNAKLFNYALSQAQIDSLIQPEYMVEEVDRGATNVQLTSGLLETGKKYIIDTYIATDDFVNVGGTNVTGNVFTATGTTPTDWTNSSILIELGNTLDLGPEGMFENIWYDWEHDISGTVTGATLQIPSASNLGATVFDGTDSKILALTDAQFDGTGDLTISGWFNARGYGEDGYGRIYDAGAGFRLYVTATPRLNMERNGGLANSTTSSIGLNKDIFYVIIAPADGNNNQFWISDDGLAPTNQTNDATAATPTDGGDLYMGNVSGGTSTFNGKQWDNKIWNRLLSAEEIQDEWEKTKK